MITKKNCVLLCFQSFLCTKHFVFNEGNFYSRSFPTHSRTSVENSTTFQEYPTIFQFSRTFQGSCEPWFPSFEWHWTHILTGLDLWKCSNCAIILLGHFDGIASSLVYSDETTWHTRWKIPLENLWKHHFRDSNFQNVSTIHASSLKNLCLWCELQSYLLFIIRLLLRNFLTALSAG